MWRPSLTHDGVTGISAVSGQEQVPEQGPAPAVAVRAARSRQETVRAEARPVQAPRVRRDESANAGCSERGRCAVLDEIVTLVLLAAAVVALLVVLSWRRRSRQRGSLAEALAPPPSPRTVRARTSEAERDAEATASGPHPGSARPRADGSAPSGEFMVKARTGSRRYYRPGSPHFRRVDADLWFRSSRDAEAAGFVPANDAGGE